MASLTWLPPDQLLATLPRFVLGTAVLVSDPDGRILMLHEAPQPDRDAAGHPARWLPPGGILNPGEDPEQAALRRLRDATGLVLPLDLLGTASYPPTTQWPATTDHWFLAQALTVEQADAISLSDAHDEWRFARPVHWHNLAAPATLHLIDTLLAAHDHGQTVAHLEARL